MAPAFKDIIDSGQFTFLIGEESKPITVHPAVFAAISDPLDRLINGNMSEAESKTAKITDAQVDDFIRFCEYAYLGDYTAPECQIEDLVKEEAEESSAAPILPKSPVSEQVVPAEPQAEDVLEEVPALLESVEAPTFEDNDTWGFGVTTKKKKKGKAPVVELSKQAKLRRNLQKPKYLGSQDLKMEIDSRYEVKHNANKHENYTPVFLAHARLYTFARMYLVNPLKSLALDKLRTTLVGFRLYTNRIGDVLELVRYVYSNEHTDDRKDDGTIDKMRKLVVKYVACEIDTFGTSSEFMELIEEGGEFAGDFWRITRDYLI